ncbi:MAG: ABC-2 transporter permease [Clostridiales bacterium]|nr:ABC-2 transporter permease [Clostridiales bacterium]
MTSVIKKELRTYFSSVIGYALVAGFVLMNAIFFYAINLDGRNTAFYEVLNNTSIIFLIMVPILTMRLFAEESKQKTDQLLFTSPLKTEQVVFGKYLSAVCFMGISMSITVLFPVILSFFSEDFPTAQVVSGYAGYFLMAAAFVSVGMFVSALTDNQIVSAFVSFVILLIIYIILPFLLYVLPGETMASFVLLVLLILVFGLFFTLSTKNLYAGVTVCVILLAAASAVYYFNPLLLDGFLRGFVSWFSVSSRFDNFYNGVLSLSDIVYYIGFSLAFIYFTINVIEKRRWK